MWRVTHLIRGTGKSGLVPIHATATDIQLPYRMCLERTCHTFTPHLMPEPTPICSTLSPAATPCTVSMYESAYITACAGDMERSAA